MKDFRMPTERAGRCRKKKVPPNLPLSESDLRTGRRKRPILGWVLDTAHHCWRSALAKRLRTLSNQHRAGEFLISRGAESRCDRHHGETRAIVVTPGTPISRLACSQTPFGRIAFPG